MSNSATIKDVAEAAGVSKSTVSRVINGKGNETRICHETQSRILAAASQLGYQVNLLAQDISLGHNRPLSALSPADGQCNFTGAIGLVLALTSPTSSLVMIQDLVFTLASKGYWLAVITLPVDPVAGQQRVSELLHGGVAGLLCCPTVYPAVSAMVKDMNSVCPVIVLWAGSAKAMLFAQAAQQAAPPSFQIEDLKSQSTSPTASPAGEPLSSPVAELLSDVCTVSDSSSTTQQPSNLTTVLGTPLSHPTVSPVITPSHPVSMPVVETTSSSSLEDSRESGVASRVSAAIPPSAIPAIKPTPTLEAPTPAAETVPSATPVVTITETEPAFVPPPAVTPAPEAEPLPEPVLPPQDPSPVSPPISTPTLEAPCPFGNHEVSRF